MVGISANCETLIIPHNVPVVYVESLHSNIEINNRGKKAKILNLMVYGFPLWFIYIVISIV